MRRSIVLFALLAVAAMPASAGTGRIIIVNSDAPGSGFNDPTPAEPVGGNSGTTRGQQRLNVFLAAAARWESVLDTDVDIRVSATFAPIRSKPCDDTQAILGHASPMLWVHSFEKAPINDVWYPIALANKLAGKDLAPPAGRPDHPSDDIYVGFNSDVDNATCLGDRSWYYGLDRNHGNDVDLFVVVLHELAHGLGVSGAATAPKLFQGRPSIFDRHTFDLKAGLRWDQMDDAQRAASHVNTGNLVWDGQHVRAFARDFLKPMTTLTITEPAEVARNYDIGGATFGPRADRTALSGRLVQAIDAADPDGPTTTDGCTPFSNADAISGNIAVVDRGTCFFATKARNAQAAGARGVVVVDQTRTTCAPPEMGGTGDDVTIPVVSLSAADGDALKAHLATGVAISGTLRVDPHQRAGGTQQGYVRLFAPCTAEPGSSTHHWDRSASPNLLMEPNISPDLLHGVDLTLYQLLDIGWTQPQRSGRRTFRR